MQIRLIFFFSLLLSGAVCAQDVPTAKQVESAVASGAVPSREGALLKDLIARATPTGGSASFRVVSAQDLAVFRRGIVTDVRFERLAQASGKGLTSCADFVEGASSRASLGMGEPEEMHSYVEKTVRAGVLSDHSGRLIKDCLSQATEAADNAAGRVVPGDPCDRELIIAPAVGGGDAVCLRQSAGRAWVRVNYRGSVDNVSMLPRTGNAPGDAYRVGDEVYVWDGLAWRHAQQRGSESDASAGSGGGASSGGLAALDRPATDAINATVGNAMSAIKAATPTVNLEDNPNVIDPHIPDVGEDGGASKKECCALLGIASRVCKVLTLGAGRLAGCKKG